MEAEFLAFYSDVKKLFLILAKLEDLMKEPGQRRRRQLEEASMLTWRLLEEVAGPASLVDLGLARLGLVVFYFLTVQGLEPGTGGGGAALVLEREAGELVKVGFDLVWFGLNIHHQGEGVMVEREEGRDDQGSDGSQQPGVDWHVVRNIFVFG